jgi:hypothetical protein
VTVDAAHMHMGVPPLLRCLPEPQAAARASCPAAAADFLQQQLQPTATLSANQPLRKPRYTHDRIMASLMPCFVYDGTSSPPPPGFSVDDRTALANRLAMELHHEAGALLAL